MPEGDPQFQSRKKVVLDLVAGYEKKARLAPSELDLILGSDLRVILGAASKSSWWNHRLQEILPRLSHNQTIREILEYFPVLTRAEVQEFGPWMRNWIPGSNASMYNEITTSGSTGKPVTIHKYVPIQQAHNYAVEVLDAVWQKRDLTKNSAFFKIALDKDEFNSLGEPFTYLGPTGKVYRRSLLTHTIAELLDFIIEKKIENFLVNAMVLKFLVQEQKTNPRSDARFSQVMNWADCVDPSLREEVRETFGAKISDRYSSSEFGFLAIQCPFEEHLHALQFINYIEILDSNNERCLVGQPGRVVVTSLVNQTMPLIRYELGDIASWGESCSHGIQLPVFTPQIVRQREAIILADGQLEIPYLDGTKLSKHPDVRNTQIYRFQDGIVVLVEARAPLPEDLINESEIEIGEVFRTSNRVVVKQVTSLEWLGIWKRKLVIPVEQPIPSEIGLDYFQELNAATSAS